MENPGKCGENVISIRVVDSGGARGPISHAEVRLYEGEPPTDAAAKRAVREEKAAEPLFTARTNAEGRCTFPGLEEGVYYAECHAFGIPPGRTTKLHPGSDATIDLALGFQISAYQPTGVGEERQLSRRGMVGRRLLLVAESRVDKKNILHYRWKAPLGASLVPQEHNEAEVMFHRPGITRLEVYGIERVPTEHPEGARAVAYLDVNVSEADIQMIGGKVGVTLERTANPHTLDQALWVAIRNRARAISFGPYREFMDRVLGVEEHQTLGVPALDRKLKELGTNLHGVAAYQLLKLATEVFLLAECGVRISSGHDDGPRFHAEDESERLGERVSFELIKGRLRDYLGSPAQLPYITRVLETAFPYLEREFREHDRVLSARINEPCLIELIWSYWHEEGMLVQTMNAINRRFQNVRTGEDRDPLANLELDPLRPLGNVLWGQIQDEPNLLSVRRRAYEYSHEYGLTLVGKATGGIHPADNRSKFLEAFHNLLHLCSVFFKEDNDTTVIADGYPLLNSLKEVHLLLAQGAHNQFGDLPWTARAEMLLHEWILARLEIRDFLQSRAMVPYKEAWMPQVDTMKTLQGWSDITVTHFRDLGVYGEQILLSIRYGDWIELTDEDHAKNWARYWRPEIQAYLHAYRAATGVDLTNPDNVDATIPALHLQRRLAVQGRVL